MRRSPIIAAFLLTSLTGCVTLDGFTNDSECVCEYVREPAANDPASGGVSP